MVRQLVLVAAVLVLVAVDETFTVQPHDNKHSQINTPGEFPYHVTLRKHDKYFCGGSLIGNQYVLTAAHCIVGVVAPPFIGITVVSGTISLSERGEHHRIKDVVVHPNYVKHLKEFYKNDIAIITLDAPITPNAFQRPIRVASSDPAENEQLLFFRWNTVDVDGRFVRTRLRPDNGIVENTQDCNEIIGEQLILDTHFCVWNKNFQLIWQRFDRGGPLVWNDELVGIKSFGHAGCSNLPDVFTRVSHYLDFINSTVKAQEFSIRSG